MSDNICHRVKSLREEVGLSQQALAEKAGISQAALSAIELGKRIPTSDTLMAIAAGLGVEPSDLLGEKFCPVCGFEYTYEEGLASIAHQARHKKAERIIARYGFFWPYRVRQAEINAAYSVINDTQAPEEERFGAAIRLFKALFSRSVIAYEHNDHPPFNEYVSMMLGSRDYSAEIPKPIYDKLVAQYGLTAGIEHGAYYQRQESEYDERLDDICSKLRGLPAKYIDVIEIICNNAK